MYIYAHTPMYIYIYMYVCLCAHISYIYIYIHRDIDIDIDIETYIISITNRMHVVKSCKLIAAQEIEDPFSLSGGRLPMVIEPSEAIVSWQKERKELI